MLNRYVYIEHICICTYITIYIHCVSIFESTRRRLLLHTYLQGAEQECRSLSHTRTRTHLCNTVFNTLHKYVCTVQYVCLSLSLTHSHIPTLTSSRRFTRMSQFVNLLTDLRVCVCRIHLYTYTYYNIHLFTCTHTYITIYTYLLAYIHTLQGTYVYLHTYIYYKVHMFICMHTYITTYIYLLAYILILQRTYIT